MPPVTPLYPLFQQPKRTEEFFSDIFDSAMGTPVGFLERYPEVEDYQQVIHSLDLASHLSSLVVLGNNEEILQRLSQLQGDLGKRVKKVLKQKMGVINKKQVQQMLCVGGNVLVGFNWTINVVVSHSKSVGCNIPLCCLQLIIREGSSKRERRVTLEMEKPELISFVETLKNIDKRLK